MFTLITEIIDDDDYVSETYILNEEQLVRLMAVTKEVKDILKTNDLCYFSDDFSDFEKKLAPKVSEEDYDFFMNYVPTVEHGYCQLKSMKFTVGGPVRLF